MSAGSDPVRVYWFWRRTLLDPNTDAERQVAATATLTMLERWYPSISRSAPPPDEGTGADLSNAWDFLTNTKNAGEIFYASSHPDFGKPVLPQVGRVAWCFSPEIPGRGVQIVGMTASKVCVAVLDDPRLVKDSAHARPDTHFWVDASALHAIQTASMYRGLLVQRADQPVQHRPW